jgi:hypothetical protein
LLLIKPVEPDALLDLVQRLGWVGGLYKAEAENLVDWLERCGCTQLEVPCVEERTFSVRFVWPQGRREGQGRGEEEQGEITMICHPCGREMVARECAFGGGWVPWLIVLSGILVAVYVHFPLGITLGVPIALVGVLLSFKTRKFMRCPGCGRRVSLN